MTSRIRPGGGTRIQERQRLEGRNDMLNRGLLASLVFAVTVCGSIGGASAFDDNLYPNWKGQWRVGGSPKRFDTVKGWGPAQQAPLIPEYQAIFEANLKDQAEGGQGTPPTYTCLSPGMPRVTNGYGQ